MSLQAPNLDVSPKTRMGLLLCAYGAELAASLWLAYEIRFDFSVAPSYQAERLFVLLWLVPLKLILLASFHQLSSLPGYFSTPDLARMFHALLISSVVTGVVWMVGGIGYAPPRGVIVVDFVFSLVGLTGVRLGLRALREMMSTPHRGKSQHARRVAIIGAGDAGAVLAHELALKPGLGLDPVVFFDDDANKWRSRVHGILVVGAPEILLEKDRKWHLEEAIIAMPTGPAKRVGEIVRILRDAHLKCRTIPSLDQLALGQVKVSQLRNVEVQDLLGREKVELDMENIRGILQDRVVLVTGAGGSIGSELCRQIASYQPRRLLLLDRSEPSLFLIEQELIGLGHGRSIKPVVADILDLPRLQQIFTTFQPEVIFHAAAHKHVPMMEHQPVEAVQNNAMGTAHLADLALRFGVERFVMISSDKAINPTNVMGATKRLSEIYVQALHTANPTGTKFMAVRFGNVLGSSGSVIPVFQKQIAEGGPVKVTHPDMTRYFMTIPEAVMLVLQSATQGVGGEIFVLDMGQPVKIVDLARQMIELSGLKPDEDIRIEFSGIRPGEKLFEELSHVGEQFVPTLHPKICRFVSQSQELEQVRDAFEQMRDCMHKISPDQLKLLLKQAVPEYQPCLSAPKPTPAPAPSAKLVHA